MAATSAPRPRRRPRPGSPERPINARMYRGVWLVLAIPLLLAAFTVSRPTPLPRPFPPAFDASSADTLARELAQYHSTRFPGSSGAKLAAEWFREQLAPYGLTVRSDTFRERVVGFGEIEFENLAVTVPGRSGRQLVVVAHRDNLGIGPGANDNASGTAMLIVLARSYAAASPTERAGRPAHTLVFLSSDGGSLGGIGAARFAAEETGQTDAVVVLDSVAGGGTPSLHVAGDASRSPPGALVRTAAARLLEQTGRAPRRPTALRQLLDLAFPFSLYEQAPFVARGVPALTITTAGDAPPPAARDGVGRLEPTRFAQIGGATQVLLGSLDQGLELTRSGTSSLFMGDRLVRGWALQLVLVAALLPFLAVAVDLFALCRRLRIPLAPAVRAYRSRLGFWLFLGAAFAALAAVGAIPNGVARPPALESEAARTLPLGALFAFGVVGVLGWIVARDRLIPRRRVTVAEELAGHTAALLVLALVSLLVVAVNPYALVFLLPSVHAWLWLPQMRDRPAWMRVALLAAGFAGPAFLVLAFAGRYGLGADAPWYLVQLTALGYVAAPLVALALAWAAAAAQLAALAGRRYAPYPTAAERPPRGPIRELVRRILLVFVNRRGASGSRTEALEA